MFSREPAPPGEDSAALGRPFLSRVQSVSHPVSPALPELQPPAPAWPLTVPPPHPAPSGSPPGTQTTGVSAHLAFVRLPDAHGDGGGELVLPEGTRCSQSVHSASRPWLEGEGLSRTPLLSGGLGAAAGRGGGRHAHLGPQPRGSPGRAPRSHLGPQLLTVKSATNL